MWASEARTQKEGVMMSKKRKTGERSGMVFAGTIKVEGKPMSFWLPPHVSTESIKRPIPEGVK
jgi:hypothetical protein